MPSFLKFIAGNFRKPEGIAGRISTFLMNRMNAKKYAFLLKNINAEKGEKILEIGFGNGFLLSKIAQTEIEKIYGLDISRDMLELVKAKNKYAVEKGKMELFLSDAANMPFEESFFDKAYTLNTVYFMDDAVKTLAEIKRVLKPKALFFNMFFSKEWMDRSSVTQYYYKKYTADDVAGLTMKAGFEIVETVEIDKNKSYCIISRKP